MKRSLCDTLAAYFRERPGIWIDARELFIAGSFAWRTRVSDCRKRGMVIENRCYKRDGYTVTEYRYQPAQEPAKEMSA